MKIVGKTDTGYLAQITEVEIGVITGFGKYPQYGDDTQKRAFGAATGRIYPGLDIIPTNTEIQVVKGLEYIEAVKERVVTAQKTAKALRELADMLDNPLPVVLAPEDVSEKR